MTEQDRFPHLRGHTLDDGKIVPEWVVAERNLTNQARIERERDKFLPLSYTDPKPESPWVERNRMGRVR